MEETAALTTEEITQNASDMELLTYMLAFACEKLAEDFLVHWGAIQKGEKATLSHEETVNLLLDHLANLNGKTRTAVIFDMLLFARHSNRDDSDAAELYHANMKSAEKCIRREIEAENQPVEATESSQDAPEATAEAGSIPEMPEASKLAVTRTDPD